MSTTRRRSPIRRRAALATGVITALAITAGPVAQAGAATPAVDVPVFLTGIPGVPAYLPALLASGATAVAKGPTVIGSTLNGGATVVVSTSPAYGSTDNSP
jgi:hypothetical protein